MSDELTEKLVAVREREIEDQRWADLKRRAAALPPLPQELARPEPEQNTQGAEQKQEPQGNLATRSAKLLIDDVTGALRYVTGQSDGDSGAEGEAALPEQISDRSIISRALRGMTGDVLGGALDELDETVDTIHEMTSRGNQYLAEQFGIPSLTYDPENGFGMTTNATEIEGSESFGGLLPDIGEPDSDGFVRNMSRFATGFIGAGKVLKPVAAYQKLKAAGKVGTLADDAVRSAASTFFGFDGIEANLMNTLEELSPTLAAAVPDMLVSNEDDDVLEQKFKAALVDAGVGAGVVGLLRMFQLVRRGKKAGVEKLVEETGVVERAKEIFEEHTGDIRRHLGQADAEDLIDETRAVTRLDPQTGQEVAEEGSIYINWARINEEDDVKALIQRMADLGAERINRARRGSQSFASTQARAAEEDAWRIIEERRLSNTNSPLNAEQSLAVRHLWAASGRKLLDLGRRIQAGAYTPADVIAFRKMLSIHANIQEQAIAVRTETARALAQWRIPAGGFEDGLSQLDSLLTKVDLDQDTEKLAEAFTTAFAHGDVGTASDFALGIARASKLQKGGVLAADAIRQTLYAALLSAPATHIRNMIGNAGKATMDIADRYTAGKIGDALGERYVDGAEVGAMARGYIDGAREAFRIGATEVEVHQLTNMSQLAGLSLDATPVGRAFKTGQSSIGQARVEMEVKDHAAFRNIASAISPDLENAGFFGRGLHAMGAVFDGMTRLPSGGLAAQDELFKLAGQRAEMLALAHRSAYSAVREGRLPEDKYADEVARLMSDPTEYIKLMSKRFAERGTFTNGPQDTPFWVAAKSIGKLPIVGRIVLPFTRTPYNIAVENIQRLPLAPLSKMWRQEFNAGGARRDIALAKVANGMMAMTVFTDLALNGYLVGDLRAGRLAPTAAGRDQERREGREGLSLRIPAGVNEKGEQMYRTFGFRGMDPISFPMAVAATIADLAMIEDFDDPDKDWESLMAAGAFSVGALFTTQNYMVGMAGLFQAFSDPVRYSESYVQNVVAMMVPSVGGAATRALDPVVREADGMFGGVLRKTPYFSMLQEPVVNFRGEVLSSKSDLGVAFDFMAPAPSMGKTVALGDAMMRDLEIVKGPPSPRVTIRDVSLNLKTMPHVYTRYKILAGKDAKEYPNGQPITVGSIGYASSGTGLANELDLLAAGKHPNFQDRFEIRTTKEEKQRAVELIIRAHRDAAKEWIYKEFPELRAELNRRAAEKETSILNPVPNIMLQQGL